MDDKYLIDDKRLTINFKDKTFSGFRKNDVFQTIFKSIESKKIESSCHWVTECILSGYTIQLWEKLMLFSSKVVNINNPLLPAYTLKKNKIFMNQISKLNLKKNKDDVLLLRNSQMIRNLFFDYITILTTSIKTKRYDKYPKINEKYDFNFHDIKKRLCAEMNILPEDIIRFNDPNELKIVINEIYTLFKNKQFGYERSCYWILWLCKWEALHKKKKVSYFIESRDVSDIPKNAQNNFIWIIWEIILKENQDRNDKNIETQIKSLYEIFKINFTNGKRNVRLPYVFNAIAYLTHDIDFSILLKNNMKIFIQVQCNVNKLFHDKKIHEIKDEKIEEIKKPPKKSNVDNEILTDKISIFNNLDLF